MLGVLLAGGKSKRFGRPKALARVKGETFLERVYKALSIVNEDIVILVSTSTPGEVVEATRRLDAKLLWDDESLPCNGPPRGLATLHRELAPRELLLAAVDYPFLTGEVLRSLVDEAQKRSAEALTPMLYPGYPLVTLGYMQGGALELLTLACTEKTPAQTRLTDVYRGSRLTLITGWTLHTSNPKILANVNTPEDLKRTPQVPTDSYLRILDGVTYRRALEEAGLGRREEAARLFRVEAEEHGSRGLTLFRIHALKDSEALSEQS